MPINERTANRDYAKPAATNLLSEDVERLRSALDGIDNDVAALMAAMLQRAPRESPQFTGTPTAPTPELDSNTAQIITAAYLLGMLSTETPVADGQATAGDSLRMARGNHRHPTDTTRAALNSPEFTGEPKAPTPHAADDSTKLATTAWVWLQGFVRGARTIFAGTGLTGGGNLSENRTIAVSFATQAEAEERASSEKVMSPLCTGQAITALLATQVEALAGASSSKLMTPQRTSQAIAAAVPPLVTQQVQTAVSGTAAAFSIVFG
jgi:hypothetical protein